MAVILEHLHWKHVVELDRKYERNQFLLLHNNAIIFVDKQILSTDRDLYTNRQQSDASRDLKLGSEGAGPHTNGTALCTCPPHLATDNKGARAIAGINEKSHQSS